MCSSDLKISLTMRRTVRRSGVVRRIRRQLHLLEMRLCLVHTNKDAVVARVLADEHRETAAAQREYAQVARAAGAGIASADDRTLGPTTTWSLRLLRGRYCFVDRCGVRRDTTR